MKSNKPNLSVIIVNLDTRQMLLECLASFAEAALKTLHAEVIVVDNGSSDGSAQAVREAHPKVLVIANESNRGFAAANNQGIKASTGKNVLLLNSDTILDVEVLIFMINYMDSHPLVGAAGCCLRNANGSLQPSITNFPRVRNDLFRLFVRIEPFPNNPSIRSFVSRYLGFLINQGLGRFADHGKEQAVDCVTGAFLVVRREVINQVGMLDEGFFFLVEEADWCYRMQRQGWSVMYVPQVSIVHLGEATSRKFFQGRRFIQMYKSRLYYHKKHKNSFTVLIYRAGVALALTIRSIFLTLKLALTDENAQEILKKREIYSATARIMLDPRLEAMNAMNELELKHT